LKTSLNQAGLDKLIYSLGKKALAEKKQLLNLQRHLTALVKITTYFLVLYVIRAVKLITPTTPM